MYRSEKVIVGGDQTIELRIDLSETETNETTAS